MSNLRMDSQRNETWLIDLAVTLLAIVIFIAILFGVRPEREPTLAPADPAYSGSILEHQDKVPVGTTGRSSKWPKLRAEHLSKYPACEACGKSDSLHVHHIVPISVNPKMELDANNLWTLCKYCHFRIGHDPDGPFGPAKSDWTKHNTNVRRDSMLVNDWLNGRVVWSPRDGTDRPRSMPSKRENGREFDGGPEFGNGSWAVLYEDGVWRRNGG